MDGNRFRRAFVTEALPNALALDVSEFYDAFENGEDAMIDYITALWEQRCAEAGVTLAEYPCFPEMMPYVLEDTEEGFCAIVTATLPKTTDAAAVKAAIVFGSAMDPRVFAAVPICLEKGESLEIVECREPLVPVGVLYQGCDNGMQLFDPPSPQKRDAQKPLMTARREEAFVDAVVCWCLQHD